MANRRALLRLSLLFAGLLIVFILVKDMQRRSIFGQGDDSMLLQMARAWTHMPTGESQTRFLDLVVERHCEDLGYVFERVTVAIYNSTTPGLLQSVANSTFCRRDLNRSMFTDPIKPFETAKFWREHWGCEPLSKRLLDMRAAGKI
mmetsp:Transcript_51900/g.131804  ORF Transcript_51900/g.131804 Transcript_51900/m.131804 type:complete len:146 (+) Transcript_51900:71-508(+)